MREVLDEVFGSSNFISLITFSKTTGTTGDYLAGTADYLLFYAKEKASAKYRQLYNNNRLNSPTLDDLPFCKRSAFKAEAEVRALRGSRTETFAVRDVPFPRGAVEKVVVNPWLHSNLFSAVQETINAIPDYADLEVMQSRLLDSPRLGEPGGVVRR